MLINAICNLTEAVWRFSFTAKHTSQLRIQCHTCLLITNYEGVTTKFGSRVRGFSNISVKHSGCWRWSTCYIEVGCDFAVCQCKPDESQTHTQSSRHISQIIAFTWNIKTIVLNLVAILRWENNTCEMSLITFGSTLQEKIWNMFLTVRSEWNNLKCLKNFQWITRCFFI